MSRLTTKKPTSEMNMTELAHNGCYAEERLARYRDFDRDIDARDFARELMVSYGLWKSCKEYGLDADNELVDDEIFDDTMLDNMQYDATTIEGLIALFYRNLWAMADLHSKLKHYEDLEEAGRLITLPCKVGDTVWIIYTDDMTVRSQEISEIRILKKHDILKFENGSCFAIWRKKWDRFLDRYIFLTKAEAEQKLAELKGGVSNENSL